MMGPGEAAGSITQVSVAQAERFEDAGPSFAEKDAGGAGDDGDVDRDHG